MSSNTYKIDFPKRLQASKLLPNKKRLFIGAYGFEQRSLGWVNYQKGQGDILHRALIIKYVSSKGRNRIKKLQKALSLLGILDSYEIRFHTRSPHKMEDNFYNRIRSLLDDIEEVVIDISALTKLLILVCPFAFREFSGTLRLVYSEAESYAPTEKEYEKSKDDMEMIAKYPCQGVESIIRTKSLSSIRMQGQPVTMVAFTSFNEQLVRHLLGTINPHRLLFINGRPPRKDFAWRERATQEIHKQLIDEYQADNPVNGAGLISRVASTLEYTETVDRINEIYKKHGNHNRIICAATGSKMQTVGLFFSKIMHPDIHVEYPTPDSYFVKRMSENVRKVHEIIIPRFSEFLESLAR